RLDNHSTLWKMMNASYHWLNQTYPQLTEDCWLCYSAQPPFYEAVRANQKVGRTNDSNPETCRWNEEASKSKGLTLESVTGKGRCVG
ncbi:ENV1 protein, partial [Sakesphorus luctuosus]|nr:ENV1 protein [Sakesphorus luctuosus]